MSLSDGEAAAFMEKKMERMRQRVAQNGVFAYLEPSSRKDINKAFLAQTIRSVDSHNRRHEESKCWKQRELDEKVVRRDEYKRSNHRSSYRKRQRSRSASREYEKRSREQSRDRSSSKAKEIEKDKSRVPSSSRDPEDERRFWAEKKARKTKEIWEGLASGTVSVGNAPIFDSDVSSDDEDIRSERNNKRSIKKRQKEKKKSEKKSKKKKKKKKRTRTSSCSDDDSIDNINS